MTKKKTLMLICIILLGAGLILYLTGFALGARVIGIGISKRGIQIHSLRNAYNAEDFVYVDQNITLEEFSSIDVQLDFAVVTLMPSDHFGFESRMLDDYEFTYDIVNGCLRLRERPSGFGVSSGFSFSLFGPSGSDSAYTEPNRITVYFPTDTMFTSVSIKCNGTDITIYDIITDEMDISLDFSNLTLENIEAASGTFKLNSENVLMKNGSFDTLSIKNDFGEMDLRQVNVSQDIAFTLNSSTVTLQDTQCEQLKISGSFNTVNADTLSAAAVKMQLESGNVNLNQLTSDSMEINNDFGKMVFNQINISQTIDITADSVTFSLQDAQCDQFDFSGSFNTLDVNALTAASVNMQLESGKVKLYELTSDRIDISNDFGKVDLELTQSLKLYQYDVSTEFGRITIDGNNMTGTSYRTLFDIGDADKWIQIQCNSCDIIIK